MNTEQPTHPLMSSLDDLLRQDVAESLTRITDAAKLLEIPMGEAIPSMISTLSVIAASAIVALRNRDISDQAFVEGMVDAYRAMLTKLLDSEGSADAEARGTMQ